MKMFKFFGLLFLMVTLLVGIALIADNADEKSKSNSSGETAVETQIEGGDPVFAGHGEQIYFILYYNYSSSRGNVAFKYPDYITVKNGGIYKADRDFKPDIILRC